MIQEEIKFIKLQVYHELIGNQIFELSYKDNISELRVNICEHTSFFIY
jgi:hypothetical protein